MGFFLLSHHHLLSLHFSSSKTFSWYSSFSLTLFLEDPAGDKLKRGEDGPLLLKRGGVGGHGTWSDASNVGMVPPAGNKEYWPAYSFLEHLGCKKAKASKNRGGEA